MNSSDIVFNLDTERRRRGWTVKEFAAMCGISERTWTNYSNEPKKIPMGIVEKASRVMQLPDTEIFKGRKR